MTLGHMHACSVVTVMSDSATQWIIACQAPLSIGFARQEIWSRLLSPPPGDLPNSGIEPMSPALQADSLLMSHQEAPHSWTFVSNFLPDT